MLIPSCEYLERLARASSYMRAAQDTDGSWQDYQLPVGRSDQWVTAFVGLGMARAAKATGSPHDRHAATSAWEFLQRTQYPEGGWGYNQHTGVDADSTAHAMLLASELGVGPLEREEQVLLGFFGDDGGVATYHGPSGWGCSHLDVTAPAALALSEPAFARRRRSVETFCRRRFVPELGWPTHWWRNHVYGAWYVLALYQRLDVPPPTTLLADVRFTVASTFDLAWLIGVHYRLHRDLSPLQPALSELWRRQLPDGHWMGAPDLRVTDPDCIEPWREPSGSYYTDHRGMITTAAVMTVMAAIIGDHR